MDLREEWRRREGILYNEIMTDKRVSAINKKYIEQHITHLKAESLDVRSIIRHLYGLKKLLESLNYIKDLKKVDRLAIEKAVAEVNTQHYSDETRLHFFGVWKSFYRWLMGEGLYYPPFIAWLKLTNKNKKKLMPDDILTEQEVMKMLDAATAMRDKVFLILLYESGARISEIMGLQKKHIDLESQPPQIMITGKTGWRRVPILLSVSWLSNYLNMEKNLREDEVIWRTLSTNCDRNGPMSYASARNMLKAIAAAAKIEKPVNPHSFRKARASHLANRLSDQQLKAFFGWVPHSDVVDHYIAINPQTLNNAYMKINGLEVREEKKELTLKIKDCPRCKFANSIDLSFCGRCGTPLSVELMIEAQNKEANMKEAIAEALKDPKAIEEIVHTYLLMQAKKGKK